MSTLIKTKDWSETGLGDISLDESKEYLDYLGLEVELPSYSYLVKIIRGTYKNIPFQNFTMLLRPRIAPSWITIKEDMLSGIGGLCTTINPFVCALLNRLGFSSCLLGSSMNGQLNSHITLGVELDGDFFWVDCANGYPYLDPINVGLNKKYQFSDFQYYGVKEGASLSIMQTKLSSVEIDCNQIVSLAPVTYSAFDRMRLEHYSSVGFGPFLSGLRLNRWQLESGFILRDVEVSDYPDAFKALPQAKIKSWIEYNFGDSELTGLWEQAADLLCMN